MDKWQFAGYVLRETAKALTPAGLGLAITGLVWQWRWDSRTALFGEVMAFGASGLLLAFVLGFDYDFLKVAVFRPYPLVAYGLLATWMGYGTHLAVTWLRRRHERLVAVVTAAIVCVPLTLGAVNWPVNDRSRDDFASRHARLLFDLLEPDATLLVYGDSDTGPVGYLHVVEHQRPDVTLYNLQGLVFSNRFVPALSPPARRQEGIRAFLEANRRPMYHMTDRILPPVRAEEHLGFLKRVLAEGKPGAPQPRFRAESAAFFKELLSMSPPRDRWVRMTRNQLLHQYGNFLGLAQISEDDALRSRVGDLVAAARKDYYALTGMVEILAEYGPDKAAWQAGMSYLQEADAFKDDSLDGERLAREYYLRGFLEFRLGDPAAAARAFQQSLDTYPSPENGARLALEQLERLRR